MRRRLLLAALAALAALALPACGSESEQLNAQDLLSRADELCREGQERFAQIQEEAPANSKDAQEQTDELVGVAEDELNELRSLRPPPELQAGYDEYLAARGRALELMEEGRDAAEDRDAAAYGKAQVEVAAEAGKRRKLAAAVGLKACSAEPKG
jgi:ElaB/YqjD/DUF883 family membrane-anchored ribosome-binding protein